MRKYIQILSALLVLAAVSCEKGTDGPGGSGTGNQEIRFPSGNSYHTGEDVIIICSGISSGASFWLVSADGTQTPLEDVTVTDSGIFFTLETAGEFTVVAEQDGERIELGRITVTIASIDVTVTHTPSYCLPGESFTVDGSGFDASAILAVATPDGSRTMLETENTETSLTAFVPEDAPRGKLDLLIVQNDGEQTISQAFFITSRKYLVRFTTSLGTGTSAYTREFSFIRDENGHVTATSPYTLTVSAGSDDRHGEYIGYDFSATEEEEENSYYPFLLKISDTEGNVLSSTFETERTDVGTGETVVSTEEFDWEYDASGFLSWYVGRYSNETVSDDGNINFEDIDGSDIYAYEDESLVNNPFAVDCTLGLQAASSADHILSVALALGFTGQRSENLPSGIAGGSATVPVTYVFDEEGYVTRASYGENSILPVTVEFVYE